MQANPRSISQLFNSQLRYVVPMFQRLYVWQESPQWRTLWEDVLEKSTLRLAGKVTNPHYLGALIIEGVRPSSPREVKRFLVIDGQQRLTTLQLLLCAFRDLARLQKWPSVEKTLTRFLENQDPDVMEVPDEEVFKLWPTSLNRDIFRAILRAGSRANVERQFPLVFAPRKRKPEPRSNLVEAYLYFSNQLQHWITAQSFDGKSSAEEVAFVLQQAIQEDFSVVEIALSEGDDSQEIFYSLNSQGRPLSQSDLLRSLIFMRAEKEKQNRDVIFSEYWSKFETPFWSTEVTRAGRSYSRLDLALRFFLMAKSGQMVDARRVNEEYRLWVGAHPPRYASVRDELADFVRHSETYAYYQTSPAVPLEATDLRRVLWDFDVSTAMPLIQFLTHEAELDETQLAACLRLIEAFIARRVFLNADSREYNKLFVELVAGLRGKAKEAVEAALLMRLLSGGGATRHWPTDEEIIEHAVSKPLFTTLKAPALRLILERLELASRNKKSEQTPIEPNLQVEHVLPQRWTEHWPLHGQAIPELIALYPSLTAQEQYKSYERLTEAIRQRSNALHTLGNLTLLNKHLNPSASNLGYTAKLEQYTNSVLRLNRHFAKESIWDEAAIAKRGNQLAKVICAIWPRPLPPQVSELSPTTVPGTALPAA